MMTNHASFVQFWTALRRKGGFALCLAMCVLVLGVSRSAKASTYITIDAPGASPGTTGLYYNNALGTIVGAYQDGNNAWHGFLRTIDGHYTIIDAPGAGTTAYRGTGGPGLNLNDLGAVTGTYVDATGARHGFLRTPDGSYTTIDVAPGVGWTWANAINLAGEIAGNYTDANGWHNFLRSRDGKFTSVDAPGATPANGGTSSWSYANAMLNLAGACIGYYFDSNGMAIGFVRAPNGAYTTIQDPATFTGSGAAGSIPMAINTEGTITGVYADSNYGIHGYLRTARGNFTNFDFPGSGNAWPLDINLFGAIVGSYYDSNGVQHGFLRTPDGTYTTLDVPGATGTVPNSINLAGQIIGTYYDADGNQHGFLRIP